MSTIWHCPDCETLNSENKCVVCGKIKPELSNNEQTSLKNVFNEKNKNPQGQSELKKVARCNNIYQEKIEYQQDQLVPKGNSYNKAYVAVIVMLVIVIILLVTATFIMIKKDDKNNAISTKDVNATVQNENSVDFVQKSETTLIFTEHEIVAGTEKNSDTVTTTALSSYEEYEKVTVAESTYQTSEKTMSTVTTTATTSNFSSYEEYEKVTADESTYQTSEKTMSTVTTSATTSKKALTQTSTVSSTASEKDWNENVVNKVMYTTQACYSHSKPKPGTDTVNKYHKGDKVFVVAITDTSYYKLNDGSYLQSSFLSENDTSKNHTLSSQNKEIRISKKSCTLTKGYSTVLSVSNCNATDIKWSTSNSDIVTVSDKGKIVGVGEGKATIYASGYGQICECEVMVVEGKITVSQSQVNLLEGESTTVLIKTTGVDNIGILEPDESIVKVECDSDNQHSILTITGISDGDAVIRVYLKGYPEIFKDITVNVSYPISIG